MPPFPITAHFLNCDLEYGMSWKKQTGCIETKKDLTPGLAPDKWREKETLKNKQVIHSRLGTFWRPLWWWKGCHWCPLRTSAWSLQECSSWWWTERKEHYSSETETSFGRRQRKGQSSCLRCKWFNTSIKVKIPHCLETHRPHFCMCKNKNYKTIVKTFISLWSL